MDEQDFSQLELFSQSAKASRPKSASGNSFLRRIRVYEKTILIAMGFLISAIVAFSLGVEKGRHLVSSSGREKIIADRQQPLIERKQAAPVPVRQDPVILQKPQENPRNYTIQLASYKSKTLAQKEADILKKKGLSPLIVSKGGYAVLCVGSFPDKEKAKVLFSELEKQYRGCFIRRI